jgi:hypothetical protein
VDNATKSVQGERDGGASSARVAEALNENALAASEARYTADVAEASKLGDLKDADSMRPLSEEEKKVIAATMAQLDFRPPKPFNSKK